MADVATAILTASARAGFSIQVSYEESGKVLQRRVPPMMQFVRKFGTRIGLAHTIWALLGASLCVLLVAGGGSGHPPAIILLPVVLAMWCAGHLIIWGIGRLAALGRASNRKTNGEAAAWPPELIIILIGTGLAGCSGLLQLAGLVVPGGLYLIEGRLWTFTMAVSLVHAVCFVALLLRRSWSRWASALLCAGWAALALRQLYEQIVHGHWTSPAEYAVLFTGIGLAAFLTYRVLSSRRVKAFLGP